ncbi:MAG: OsmC family protein [Halioglobus sp.]
MQDLPHVYQVTGVAQSAGNVVLSSNNVPDIVSAPPAEFGGPGDQWSPESLLVAAVADCYVLTFRAIAAASKVEWINLSCSADGVLDREERVTKFTQIKVRAELTVPADVDPSRAQRLMEKAEAACLITSSLSAECHLEASVVVA